MLKKRFSDGTNCREDRATEDDQPTFPHDESVSVGVNNLSHKQLLLVEEALERLHSEEFGVCVHCGEQIPVKRLRAVPWGKSCVACAERAELRTG